MGSVRRDIHKKAREYEEQYDLKSEVTVKAFLENRQYIIEAMNKGDIDAMLILVDYEDAIKKAKLSAREKETLNYLYDLDLSEREAADKIGISRKALRSYHKRAINKIIVYTQFIEEEI